MAVTIRVSSAQFEAAARRFETSRDKCVALAQKVMNTCTGLQSKWKSPAATQYYNKLQQINGDLNDMKRIIGEHIDDLREIKKIFEVTEDNAATKTASLETDVLQY